MAKLTSYKTLRQFPPTTIDCNAAEWEQLQISSPDAARRLHGGFYSAPCNPLPQLEIWSSATPAIVRCPPSRFTQTPTITNTQRNAN